MSGVAMASLQEGHSGPQEGPGDAQPTCQPRGTCEPTCPLYGWCHCGCGERAGIKKWSNTARGYVGGRYHRYRWMHMIPHEWSPGFGPEKGEPAEELLREVETLVSELGVAGAAKSVGISRRTIWEIRTGETKTLRRATAAAIRRAYNRLDQELFVTKVPMMPLRDAFAANGLSPATVWDRNHPFNRYFYRGQVSMLVADEMAVSAGFHPAEVWGEDWWA